jgi:hypothetical protein
VDLEDIHYIKTVNLSDGTDKYLSKNGGAENSLPLFCICCPTFLSVMICKYRVKLAGASY